MSETPTPRTDASLAGRFSNPEFWYVNAEFSRQLERELNESKELVKLLEENSENYRELLNRHELVVAEPHQQQQAASNNADWFDAFVKDLSQILQCDPKPHIILAVVENLKRLRAKNPALTEALEDLAQIFYTETGRLQASLDEAKRIANEALSGTVPTNPGH